MNCDGEGGGQDAADFARLPIEAFTKRGEEEQHQDGVDDNGEVTGSDLNSKGDGSAKQPGDARGLAEALVAIEDEGKPYGGVHHGDVAAMCHEEAREGEGCATEEGRPEASDLCAAKEIHEEGCVRILRRQNGKWLPQMSRLVSRRRLSFRI